jgi:glutamine synthetase
MVIAPFLPQATDHELAALTERFAAAGVRVVIGSVVDHGGVARAKQTPVARAPEWHRAGLGASPTWNVFCIDNAIAFTPTLGVVGDLRLRADLAAHRILGDGLLWAPAEFFSQSGEPSDLCPRGLLRRTQSDLEEQGLTALVGCEIELVLTLPDGAPLPRRHWSAYGLGAALDQEPFLSDLVRSSDEVGLSLEQVHAEYGENQFELSLPPRPPLQAADDVVLARLVAARVARRHGMAVSLSPQPFLDGSGNGAHQHLSLAREGTPLLSGGTGPHGLTDQGAAVVAGVVAGLPETLAVFAGSLLSGYRLQPDRWAGAFACWGLENREAAVRLCAATPGNPHGASLEMKCVDPSANPYIATAVILGLALDGLARGAVLPAEVTGRPADQSPIEAAASRTVPLASDQETALDLLEKSELAQRLLGPPILEAMLAVRRHEVRAYAGTDPHEVADRFRLAWTT